MKIFKKSGRVFMRKSDKTRIKVQMSNNKRKQISFTDEPWYQSSFQKVAASLRNNRSGLVDYSEVMKIEAMMKQSKAIQRS
jgi:hypothetical protein